MRKCSLQGAPRRGLIVCIFQYKNQFSQTFKLVVFLSPTVTCTIGAEMRWAMAISDLVRDKESVRIFAVQTKKA